MKLTAVLVNYRDLVGVGKCAEGQSKCKPWYWVLKGKIQGKGNRLSRLTSVSGGAEEGGLGRVCWFPGQEEVLFRNQGWKASPQDRAVKSELGEEQEMVAPSQVGRKAYGCVNSEGPQEQAGS